MDRNPPVNNTFYHRAEYCDPDKVKALRNTVIQNVNQKAADDEIILLKKYHKYTVSLPPLSSYPDEFQQQYKDALIDLDMKDDLERSEVINWCRTTKQLYPLKTTADGNCLLHAVSLALWGIEDTDNLLRRLLYVNMTRDPHGRFKRRWLMHQKNAPELKQFDIRLNTQDYNLEWENVLKATADIERTGNHGLPYTALESIHLYILANMLQRPIIVLADRLAHNVYGQTMQESHLGGIYLPLDLLLVHCHKAPIVIGYNMNHFAPMVWEEDLRTGPETGVEQVVPIITKDIESLVLQYILPEEENQCASLLQNFTCMKEVVYTNRNNIMAVMSVKLIHRSLPDNENIMSAYRTDCERKFRRQMDMESGYYPAQGAANVGQVAPFNFQVAQQPENIPAPYIAPPRANIGMAPLAIQPEPINYDDQTQYIEGRRKCRTIGCDMFGDPNTANLCDKCFKDFTIQYDRQETAAKKKQQQSARHPAPAHVQPQQYQVPVSRPVAREDNYHDLSMMGADCQARCGFKCSTETYPFCHECYPGNPAQHQTQPPVRPQQQQQQPEISMLPDECKGQGCKYRCSKATYPFCHGCFDKLKMKPQPDPTAPPPSVPMVTDPAILATQQHGQNQHLMLRIEPRAQPAAPVDMPVYAQPGLAPTSPKRPKVTIPAPNTTAPMQIQSQLGELNIKCATRGCTSYAIKGNNGTCEACYQNSLFGEGNNASASPPDEQINKLIQKLDATNMPTHQTCSCGEIITPGSTQCIQCFLKGGSSPMMVSPQAQASGMNIVPMNITPSAIGGNSDEKILNSAPGLRPSLELGGPPLTQAGSMRSEPEQHDETAVNATGPVYTAAGSQPTTYRKHICATPGCEGTRIKNEYNLCLTCLENQGSGPRISSTRSNLEESPVEVSCSPLPISKEQMKELNPVVVSSKQKVKCASPTCEKLIYPPRKLCEDCTKVLESYKAKSSKDENIKSVPETTGPCKTPGCEFFGAQEFNGLCSSCYKSKVPPTRHTAPLTPMRPRLIEVTQRHNTAPLTPVISSGKPCIEKGCTRFGDPAQGERCPKHFQEAINRFPPNISEESIHKLTQPYIAPQQPAGPSTANQNTGRQYAVGLQPINRNGLSNQNIQVPMAVAQQSNNRTQNGTANQNERMIRTEPMEAQQIDPYVAVMSKVEGSRKSTNLCKNNAITGCINYGNSSKRGYCNGCYPEIQRRDMSTQKHLAQNQFG